MPGKPKYGLKELKMLKEWMKIEKEKLESISEIRNSTEIREVIEDMKNYIKEKDTQIENFILKNLNEEDYFKNLQLRAKESLKNDRK